MIGGTSGVDLIGFVVYAVAGGTAYGLFTLIWRAGHTRGRLEAELACCRAKGTDDVKVATEEHIFDQPSPFSMGESFEP